MKPLQPWAYTSLLHSKHLLNYIKKRLECFKMSFWGNIFTWFKKYKTVCRFKVSHSLLSFHPLPTLFLGVLEMFSPTRVVFMEKGGIVHTAHALHFVSC